MTTPLDLEELKRLVAGARLPLKHERTEYASMITDGRGRTLLGVSRSYMEHVGDCEAHLDLFVGASNALPELIARVERAEKERDRLRRAAKAVNDAWRGMPSSWSVYETTKHVVRALEPAVWKLQSTLNGDTSNV